MKLLLLAVVMMAMASGCATSPGLLRHPVAAKAEAAWIMAQVTDELLGCPLGLTRRSGGRLVDSKSCTDVVSVEGTHVQR